MRFIKLLSLSLFLGMFVTACSTNPVTGKRQFSIISPAQEVAMGKQNYEPYQQQQGGEYTVDKGLTRYVSSVGQKLAAVSDRKDLPYEFVVLNNDVPNAWALPGGKIAINRGLLVMLKDEAQLASVLGHEIVHAAARHGATQMTNATLLNIGAQTIGLVTQNNQYGSLIGIGTNIGAGAWQASYGRSQELESDEYGIEYMVRAGYDPYAAVELQEIFLKLSGNRESNFLEAWMASHPPSAQRVARNKELAAKYGSGGKRNEQAYARAIAQAKKDQPAYDSNNQAVKAAGQKDFATANSLIDKAIRMQPKEAIFQVTKGQIALAQNQYSTAESAFKKANSLNPGYYAGYVGAGVAQIQQQNINGAKSSFEKSLKYLPTQTATFYLGEISLRNNNKQQALEYYSFAAQGGGELGAAAQKRVGELQPAPTTSGQ